MLSFFREKHVHRCRLCRRPLNGDDVRVFKVRFVDKKNAREFVDANNQSVKLVPNDVLCNYCVVEAKINSTLQDFFEEWAQDYTVVSTRYENI